jgi:Methyltransferase FkbM domain
LKIEAFDGAYAENFRRNLVFQVLFRAIAIIASARFSALISCCGEVANQAGGRTPVVNGRPVFGLASLEEHAAYPGSDQEAVRVAKLDDVLDGDVGFVKIDVEGHELRVLEGASSLIERCRPILFIECEERHNPGGPAALFSHLKKAGYIGRFLREGVICDIAEFSLTRDQLGDPGAPYIYNFFFFPDGDHLELVMKEP